MITKIIFCFRGSRIPVRMGIGRNRMARSVIILTGAEDRYNVTISVHEAEFGIGFLNVAVTGRH